MAYKFQSGKAVLSGAVDQEGTITLYNASGDEKGKFTNAGVVSGSGAGQFASLTLDSTAVTSTAAELNYVDIASLGTGAASKALVFDANGNFDGATNQLILTASAVSSSQLELALNAFSINGTAVSSTAAELNLVDGSTAGTIVNSKAVVYGSSGEVNATTLQIAGSSITATAAELNYNDIAALGTGAVSKAVVFDADGQFDGATAGLIFSASAVSGTVVNVPFSGLEINGVAVSSTAAELNLIDGSSAGTIVNSKAVVYGSSGEVNATTLQIAGSSITATAAEVNYNDIASLGTGAVSKALVFDADGQFDGATNGLILSASIVSGTVVHVPYSGLKINGTAVSSTAAELNILDGVTATAAELNYNDIASLGTGAVSKAVVFDADGQFDGVTNGLIFSASVMSASNFYGNGSGITNISAGNISAAGSDKQIQFNQNGDFAGDAGLTFDGSGSILVSGSSSGKQQSQIILGTSSGKLGYLQVGDDDGYILEIGSNGGGLDLSGSEGVTAFTAEGTNFAVVSSFTTTGLTLSDFDDNQVVKLGHDGSLSGSAGLMIQSININEAGSISSAGAATFSNLNLGSGGITNAGSIAGATSVVAQTLSASSTLQVGGAVTMASLGNATVALTDDLMIIDDGASGAIKTTSLAAYATAIAGAGLTATAGVLSVDARATPQEIGDANGTLKEGMNFATGSISAGRTWTLPASPDEGDVVSVKAPANAATYNITVARAGSQTIDGETSLIIESNYGAVDLVYVATNVWSVK